MRPVPTTPDTAAEAVAALCDTMAGDTSIRIVDATKNRRVGHVGAEVAEAVRRDLHNLLTRGVAAGDTVLFAVRPSLAAMTSFLALIMAGARVVFADLTAPTDLLDARLRLVAPQWALTEPIISLIARTPLQQLARRFGTDVPALHRMARRVITTADRSRSDPDRRLRAPDPSDEALVVFTSGTTDAPKAVAHTQATLRAMLERAVEIIGGAESDTVYADRFHAFVPALAAGATVVIGQPEAPPAVTAEVLCANDVTLWFATPTAALQTLPLLSSQNSLEHIVLGSAPVTSAVVQDIGKLVPTVEVTAVYGMTEVLPVAVASGAAIVGHTGVGDLVGELANDLDLELDLNGELIISGARVAHYVGEEARPIRTGDTGYLRIDGQMVLDGRVKDMILVAGRNIYPRHYERWLCDVHGVSDGALAGVRNRYGDEQMWIVVEPDQSVVPIHQVLEAVSANEHLSDLPFSGLVAAPIPYLPNSTEVDRDALRGLVAAALEAGSAVRSDGE